MNAPAYATPGTEGLGSLSLLPAESSTKPVATSAATATGSERAAWKAVYCVAERGKGRRIWLRVGTAFPNRDGSLTIRLDALPLSGQLQVREPFASGPRDPDSEPLTEKPATTAT
ncbi:MAG: hypothetical protein KA258_04320 [Deltaproteobacteria bacterium]|jgi:hypothetical protein|nr:hypothetical protein [Deltaproteobacteria bacterium]